MGSSLGTGGMETKIIAAEIATGAGVTTIITSSKRPENMFDIIEYHSAMKETIPTSDAPLEVPKGVSTPIRRPPHTVFMPSVAPTRDLKAWTSHTLFPAGSVVIDSGAHRVLSRRESGGRLLAAGVLGVMGAFASGQAVRIVIRASTGDDSTTTSGTSSAYSSRPVTPTPHNLQFTDIDAGEAAAAAPQQFKDEDVIEVGRGLAMYNYAQISKVHGLNRFVLAFHCSDRPVLMSVVPVRSCRWFWVTLTRNTL